MRLVTFETQLRVDRAWRTEAIFNDRQSAVAEAERILAGKRTPAVRVVQVLYDPKRAECSEYTVFRATSFDEENARARKRLGDQEMFEWGSDGRKRGAKAPHHWQSWVMAAGACLAVLAVFFVVRWAI